MAYFTFLLRVTLAKLVCKTNCIFFNGYITYQIETYFLFSAHCQRYVAIAVGLCSSSLPLLLPLSLTLWLLEIFWNIFFYATCYKIHFKFGKELSLDSVHGLYTIFGDSDFFLYILWSFFFRKIPIFYQTHSSLKLLILITLGTYL